MWSSKYVSGISMFYMFICEDILQRVVETEIWEYYILQPIILIEGFAVNEKADPLIEHLNIPDFSTTFPPDVFTLQNFTPKVYPINCLVPAFLFATKPTLNLKTQFLHLLLSLFSKVKLELEMFFLLCLMGLLFTRSCSTTFNLWNMTPKNREILAKFGWSAYTLNTLYFVLYISNIRNEKPRGQRNLEF